MHGWLAAQPDLGWIVEGIAISPETRTRNVEYAWVADRLRGSSGIMLDAASGFMPGWHVMPDIATALGYEVVAMDLEPASLNMPPNPRVIRVLGNLLSIDAEDHSFDVVTCISVLEHLSINEARLAARELCRVARSRIIVTADDAPWLPSLFEEYADAGAIMPFAGVHLAPPVYAMVATLRT